MKAYMKIVLVLLLVSMLVACSNGRFGNITASLDASEAGVEEDEGLKREFCKVSSLQEQYCLLENTVGETYCIDRSYAEDYKVGDLVLLLYSERTVMENGCYAAEVFAVYPNTNRLSPLAN